MATVLQARLFEMSRCCSVSGRVERDRYPAADTRPNQKRRRRKGKTKPVAICGSGCSRLAIEVLGQGADADSAEVDQDQYFGIGAVSDAVAQRAGLALE